ncbi:MAG: amidohydrolase family protein [Chthoniobacterales bacterium]
MKIYQARIVYPVHEEPFEDGAVAVNGDRIVAVGKAPELSEKLGCTVEDLGDVILMPGLINAHCHLDYTAMRGAILPSSDFAQWIERINALKRMLTDEDYLASIAEGFAELRQWGCTSVFNIESFPELMVKMPPPPLRTWWFIELLNVRNRHVTEELVAGALTFFEDRPDWLGGFGLSPHAPYTASEELYRLTALCAEKYGMPVTTHLAETSEEYDMFKVGRGTLYTFLKNLGRPMHDTGKGSPFATLVDQNVLPRNTICVHMNYMDSADFQRIRDNKLSEVLSVVHCPNCHRYFNRSPFPLERFLDAGVSVSLGTDSLASNSELNLFSEMRTLRSAHPQISCEATIQMVTLQPARAIGMTGKLGILKAGALADMIAVPAKPSIHQVAAAIIDNQQPITWMLVAGQR